MFGLEENFEIIPRIDYELVPLWYTAADIFVVPSRYETFGLVIVEAMACGVPVVTTDVYGPKEIIKHNYDGIAVPPDDVDALAVAVETLLKDDELRERIAENALKTVQERYDIRHHAKHLVSIYCGMVA